MPRRPAPLRAVAALLLGREQLGRPRATALTARRLGRFIEDVGGLQLDSINVLDRAHYLTVWSRFGPYDRARLDRLVYRRRLLFEYWAHAACLVPTSMLPWWRRAMLDYRVRHTGWSNWLRRNAKVLSLVKASVQANGPMGNADFEGRRPAGGRRGWWDWKPVQHALHYLWMTGALTVHSRRHFQKRFDLLERAMPDVLGIEAVSSEEFQRWHLERSTPGPRRVHGYYTLPILHHGHLIGRLDAKAHRAERRLEVRHAHFESWFASVQAPPAGGARVDQDEALAGLGEALGSLAAFVGADEVTLRRVTPRRLRAPLARTLRGAAPAGDVTTVER